jgi:hypothetical protein
MVCDAVLLQDDRATGPLRLPMNRADDFIAHFNRTYEGLGIRLAAIKPESDTKIPGSLEAAGDDVSR